jgi:hypothetical protein
MVLKHKHLACPTVAAAFLIAVLATACDPKSADDGDSGTSSVTSSSSTTESMPVLGEPTLEGDPICAAYTTEETCAGVEVAPSIFCKWQRTAFLPDGSETCEPLELSAGCFAYDDPSVDPTCLTPDECETPLGFVAPYGRAIEGGWLVVNSCGSSPTNGFDGCGVGEAAPFGCRCVCDLAQ